MAELEKENDEIIDEAGEELEKPPTTAEEKSAASVVFDKKGAARLKSLEEKNSGLEEKLGLLLAHIEATSAEINSLKEAFKLKTPEQKKNYLQSLNEYISAMYK